MKTPQLVYKSGKNFIRKSYSRDLTGRPSIHTTVYHKIKNHERIAIINFHTTTHFMDMSVPFQGFKECSVARMAVYGDQRIIFHDRKLVIKLDNGSEVK